MVAERKKKRGGKLEREFGNEPIDPQQIDDDIAVALRDVAQWQEHIRQGKFTTPAELEMVAIRKAQLETLLEKRRYYQIIEGSRKPPR